MDSMSPTKNVPSPKSDRSDSPQVNFEALLTLIAGVWTKADLCFLIRCKQVRTNRPAFERDNRARRAAELHVQVCAKWKSAQCSSELTMMHV